MTKGRFSEVEKMAMLHLVSEGLGVDEIAEKLGRRPSTIQKHMPEIKPDTKVEVEVEEDVFVIDDSHLEKVKKDLIKAGVTNSDSDIVIQKTVDKAKEKGKVYKGANAHKAFYADCIKNMRAGNFMIKKTQGGREGVAIMTPAASQKSDSSRGSRLSRKAEGNLFNTSGEKITK